MSSARARAFANLALVKYFGKRDPALNLPAAGSLSLTLEPLATETQVHFSPLATTDEVMLNGASASAQFARRVSDFLDLIRRRAGTHASARVETTNDFPTAAGLASSASGFAALTLAASAALNLDLDPIELSILARRGSGSACRSIPGGIVIWHAGQEADGSDSFAQSIAEPQAWDLRVVVGISDSGPKSTGSTKAMELTRETSPYYAPWLETVRTDLRDAYSAVTARDFHRLGLIAEQNAIAMHAAALAARPSIVFWNGTTINALRMIRDLRERGVGVYFTCDAGPQPKALCLPGDEATVAAALAALPGILKVIHCRLGGPAVLTNRSCVTDPKTNQEPTL